MTAARREDYPRCTDEPDSQVFNLGGVEPRLFPDSNYVESGPYTNAYLESYCWTARFTENIINDAVDSGPISHFVIAYRSLAMRLALRFGLEICLLIRSIVWLRKIS